MVSERLQEFENIYNPELSSYCRKELITRLLVWSCNHNHLLSDQERDQIELAVKKARSNFNLKRLI